jgi:RNA-binding protein YhbY
MPDALHRGYTVSGWGRVQVSNLGRTREHDQSRLTAAVLQSIEQALRARELIKIRFDHDRDERDVLAGKVAESTGATLIMQVGKVAVYYRQKAPASND